VSERETNNSDRRWVYCVHGGYNTSQEVGGRFACEMQQFIGGECTVHGRYNTSQEVGVLCMGDITHPRRWMYCNVYGRYHRRWVCIVHGRYNTSQEVGALYCAWEI